MQKGSQISIISADIRIPAAAIARGMLISPGMVVNVVNKKLDHIVLVTLSVDLR